MNLQPKLGLKIMVDPISSQVIICGELRPLIKFSNYRKNRQSMYSLSYLDIMNWMHKKKGLSRSYSDFLSHPLKYDLFYLLFTTKMLPCFSIDQPSISTAD